MSQSPQRLHLFFVDCTSMLNHERAERGPSDTSFLPQTTGSSLVTSSLSSIVVRSKTVSCVGLWFDTWRPERSPLHHVMSHSHSHRVALNHRISAFRRTRSVKIRFDEAKLQGDCVLWCQVFIPGKFMLCSDLCQAAPGWWYNLASSWDGSDVTLKTGFFGFTNTRGCCCLGISNSGLGGDMLGPQVESYMTKSLSVYRPGCSLSQFLEASM